MRNTALITGGSGGIGLELSKLFASDGIDLMLVARNEEKLINIKEELETKNNIEVHILPIDLSVKNSPNKIFDFTKDNDLRIEYLINNAGFGHFGYFYDNDWEKEASMINLNITSLTHLTKLFLAEMIEKNSGKILNVASTAAFQPGPLMAVYYATKAYVLHFSEAINEELDGKNITVTALCPGPTETSFQERAEMEDSKFLDIANLQTARDVAEFGYNAMQKGQSLAIPGFSNKITAFMNRILPRKTIVNMVKNISLPK